MRAKVTREQLESVLPKSRRVRIRVKYWGCVSGIGISISTNSVLGDCVVVVGTTVGRRACKRIIGEGAIFVLSDVDGLGCLEGRP